MARALNQVGLKWQFIRESMVKFYENAVPFLIYRYTKQMVETMIRRSVWPPPTWRKPGLWSRLSGLTLTPLSCGGFVQEPLHAQIFRLALTSMGQKVKGGAFWKVYVHPSALHLRRAQQRGQPEDLKGLSAHSCAPLERPPTIETRHNSCTPGHAEHQELF